MDNSPLSHENLSFLIDHVIKSKDPATVGLRKILKKQEEESKDFTYHSPVLNEFDVPGSVSKSLNDNDKLILELEKKVNDLQVQLKKLEDDSRKAEQISFEKGRGQGFSEGLLKGKNEAADEFNKKIDGLQQKTGNFLKYLEESKRAVFAGAERLLLRLCFEITTKVISNEIKENSDIILSVIKKALTYIADRERIIIRVAKNDFENVSNNKDFWLPVTERLQDILIEQDERIEQGGCIIESNSGMVDARLGVQCDELFGLVEKVWENVNSSSKCQDAPEQGRKE
jgi:flagellar biosynthesis/type III secretory pathway protein FliH